MSKNKVLVTESDFLDALRKNLPGWCSFEDCLRLGVNQPDQWAIRKFVSEIEYLKKLEDGSFSVQVNYNKSLNRMIEECNFRLGVRCPGVLYGRDYITPQNFPKGRCRGIHKKIIRLCPLLKGMSDDEMKRMLAKNHLRHARIEEMLALIAQYPGVLNDSLLIAIGSRYKCEDDGFCRPEYGYPSACMYKGSRHIYLRTNIRTASYSKNVFNFVAVEK